MAKENTDPYYRFFENSPPTPPLAQHFVLSEKLVL